MTYLTAYRTASTTHTELIDGLTFPQKVNWFPDTYKRAKSGMFYAPHKLAEKVLDPELIAKIKARPLKTAFILAAGNGHFAGINARPVPDNDLNYVYKFLPFTLTQVYAGRTAQAFGNIEHIATDSTACASSLKSLMDVQTLIEMYGFERVIVLSVEDAVSNSVLEFFGEAQASLLWKDEEKGIQPSAFDNVNGGFHVGQGAVLAVFEAEHVAKDPIAQLISAYTASENHTNAIGQREDGAGYVRAIQGALDFAGINPIDVKVIKTHGTGTKSNNVAETFAIESIFKKFVATSYKPRIGHTMGASGLLETCLLLDDLAVGVVPKILNRTSPDGRYLSEDAENPGGLILSLASGMGNVYSAAVLTTEF
jgi:3-oxoacyl-(acyl-carrier-protein) synthase